MEFFIYNLSYCKSDGAWFCHPVFVFYIIGSHMATHSSSVGIYKINLIALYHIQYEGQFAAALIAGFHFYRTAGYGAAAVLFKEVEVGERVERIFFLQLYIVRGYAGNLNPLVGAQ